MPTGYTAKLTEEGQDFKSFAMTCARAMGACVMMRDDPTDAPIVPLKPSDHHVEGKLEAEKELDRLYTMSDYEKNYYGEKRKEERTEFYNEAITRHMLENSRLDEMAAKVARWLPPTTEHYNFKEFMLNQIKISRNEGSYYEDTLKEIEARDPASFAAEDIETAVRDIEYHRKNYLEECKRTDERNKWIKDLQESLNRE